jgi:hypothetical protein
MTVGRNIFISILTIITITKQKRARTRGKMRKKCLAVRKGHTSRMNYKQEGGGRCWWVDVCVGERKTTNQREEQIN